MDKIEEFVDQRHKSWCIYCGEFLARTSTNFDHVPTKSLLRKPHPHNLPKVEVCSTCNNDFSGDEEYFSLFLRCVIKGSTDPTMHDEPTIQRALARHEELRKRIEKSKVEQYDLFGGPYIQWQPEIDRLKRIIVKNARGHAFYECGEPMLSEPSLVWFKPLVFMGQNEIPEFENINNGSLYPEVGSRLLARMLSEQDLNNGWVMVQNKYYRYGITFQSEIIVKTVIHDYLATLVVWN